MCHVSWHANFSKTNTCDSLTIDLNVFLTAKEDRIRILFSAKKNAQKSINDKDCLYELVFVGFLTLFCFDWKMNLLFLNDLKN